MGQRLIDANALISSVLKKAIDDAFLNGNTDMHRLLIQVIAHQPTIDAVPLDGSFLKMSKGNYLIYNRHWLYEHFDMEMEIQRSAMKSMGYEPALKDAEPVRHGKWIFNPSDAFEAMFAKPKCSECGFESADGGNYCPNCGARMDKE